MPVEQVHEAQSCPILRLSKSANTEGLAHLVQGKMCGQSPQQHRLRPMARRHNGPSEADLHAGAALAAARGQNAHCTQHQFSRTRPFLALALHKNAALPGNLLPTIASILLGHQTVQHRPPHLGKPKRCAQRCFRPKSAVLSLFCMEARLSRKVRSGMNFQKITFYR